MREPTLRKKSVSPPTTRRTPSSSPPRVAKSEVATDPVPIDPALLEQTRHQPATHTSPRGRASQPPPPSTGEQSATASPISNAPARAFPWRLQTDVTGDSSQPTSSASSPATPGLGPDGLYHGQRDWTPSRQTSMSDMESYVGATKGLSTAASSESGVDKSSLENIPPPKPKKSHARKVSICVILSAPLAILAMC